MHVGTAKILGDFIGFHGFWVFTLSSYEFVLHMEGYVNYQQLQQLSRALGTDRITVLACAEGQQRVGVETKHISQDALQRLTDIIGPQST